MFYELQKKAKAVLKKVNYSGNNYIESSTLRRRSSDIVTGSTSKLMMGDTEMIQSSTGNNVREVSYNKNDYKEKSDFIKDPKSLSGGKPENNLSQFSNGIPLSTFSSKMGANNEHPKLSNNPNKYLPSKIKSFIVDDILLKNQNVYIGGGMYLFIVQIFALLLLMAKDVMFVNGVLCGIAVVMLVLVVFFLFTYSHAFEIHEYCMDLRTYILNELKHNPTKIDFTKIPTTGIVQKNLHTYKGWVYLTTEYERTKPLIDQNPCVAFMSFGKHSLSIYVVAIVPVENKRHRTNNFNVVKHFRLNYSGIEFELVPEGIPRKKYWSKKLPIKLNYNMGSLVSKRLDPFVPSYQKILEKMNNNNPSGPLPVPNQKYNNVKITFNYSGGDIYIFALTGREKERWYRSLLLCIENGPSARSRTFKDIIEFSNVNVDSFSVKIDFINKVKEILAYYKTINSLENQESTPQTPTNTSSHKNNSPNNSSSSSKKTASRDFLKIKNIKSKSTLAIQMIDEPLNDKNIINDKSLPLNYNSSANQQQMSINCDTVNANASTGTETNKSRQGRNDNVEPTMTIPDNMLTMNYILSSKSTLALNLLAYRLAWDVWREDRWTNAVKMKIQTKINSLKLPTFIKKLTIEQLDLGDRLPVFCSNCDPALDSDGGIWLNLPLVYNGKLSFTFNTQLDVSIYDRLIVKAAKSTNDSTYNINLDEDSDNATINDPVGSTKIDCLSPENDPYSDDLHIDRETASVILDVDDDNNETPLSTDVNSGYSPNVQFVIDEENNMDFVEAQSDSNANLIKHIEETSSTDSKSELYKIKMDQLLKSKSGKKLFNVVEKLAQSNFVKKLGRTEIAQKIYKAAKNKLSNLNVILTINVTSIKGTLVLYIPPPPSDRLWFGFKTQPAVSLQISTKLNTKNIRLPILIQFIDSKIKSEFKDVLVLPNMEDLYIPFMSADIDYSE